MTDSFHIMIFLLPLLIRHLFLQMNKLLYFLHLLRLYHISVEGKEKNINFAADTEDYQPSERMSSEYAVIRNLSVFAFAFCTICDDFSVILSLSRLLSYCLQNTIRAYPVTLSFVECFRLKNRLIHLFVCKFFGSNLYKMHETYHAALTPFLI